MLDPAEAPYKASRAAFRNAYGTRSINASAPQSKQDFTPSGRIRYRETALGQRESEASAWAEQDFYDMLRKRMGRPTTGGTQVNLGFGTGTAAPIMEGVNYPANAFQPVATPYSPVPASGIIQPPQPTPLAFNLSEPSPYMAADIAPYAQPASSPIAPFVPSWKKRANPGYMGSILDGPNKWLT